MANPINAVKKAANKIRDIWKTILKVVRFIMSTIGRILMWIPLIIFIILLIMVISRLMQKAFTGHDNLVWNYSTFQDDLEVIKQLNESGYESMVNSENFQDFKAYEYGVLMDVANYLFYGKQEMFDLMNEEYISGDSLTYPYRYERNYVMQKTDKMREIYNKRIQELQEEYANACGATGERTTVPLMKVEYNTNQQNMIADEDVAKHVDAGMKSARNYDIDDVIKSSGYILGGTNRVKGPYLVFEFLPVLAQDMIASDPGEREYTRTVKTNIEETIAESNSGGSDEEDKSYGDSAPGAISEGDATSLSPELANGITVEEKIGDSQMVGNLVPYIYVVRDNLEFHYYFSGDQDSGYQAIEYPMLLNVYNCTLNLGSENAEEAKRALYGLAPKVWPDEDVEKYTKVPFYQAENIPTIYKIPLQTIIGRYMPRAELLMAWSYVKEDIESETSDSMANTEDLVKQTIEAIKGIYNEAGLSGEQKKAKITSEVEKVYLSSGITTNSTYHYTSDQTNEHTFVSFEKAGIESTKYDMEGFTAVDEKKVSNVRIVTDFVSANVIDPTVTYTYRAYTDQSQLGSGTKEFNIQAAVEDGRIGSAMIQKSNVILANGNPEEGYTPPGGVEGADALISGRDIDSIKRAIEIAFLREVGDSIYGRQGWSYSYADGSQLVYTRNSSQPSSSTSTSSNGTTRVTVNPQAAVIQEDTPVGNTTTTTKESLRLSISSTKPMGDEDYVRYNPIFIVSEEEIKPAVKLKIKQKRMPVLLVKSATTWCRSVNYVHTIKQNAFRQNSTKYLIPKSVSSMGLVDFTTSEQTTYRGKAYAELLSKTREKDVVNMLAFLERVGQSGKEDAYEYIRDLNRIIVSAKEYLKHNNKLDYKIDENTYKYVYVPNSITYYDDSQSQKIYWTQLLVADKQDELTEEEVGNFRTRNREISWQVVDYPNYPECNGPNGETNVYALNPFGSQYARAMYERMYERKGTLESVSGGFNAGIHNGADWDAREGMTIMRGGSIAGISAEKEKAAQDVVAYEKERLKDLYSEEQANDYLKEVFEKEEINMPIVAVAPGVILHVDYAARPGIYVDVKHTISGDEVITRYLHLKRWPIVEVGDYVGAGTILGYEGTTGRSTGYHLHFEVLINGKHVSPAEYVFPSFNPFFYKEKASDKLSSEYMSLERTIKMVNVNGGETFETLNNQHPMEPLITDYSNLDNRPGYIQEVKSASDFNSETPASVRKAFPAYDLGWSQYYPNESAKEYTAKLLAENDCDFYLKAEYFDKAMATAAGYLVAPFELLDILYGNITVKTDMLGALPELTKEELEYILQYWLAAKYSAGDQAWLKENVFTDETINKIISGQNETKVSAVFALAVATIEQSLGLSKTTLALPPNYNIFSIKGRIGGGVEYQSAGTMWNKYQDYGDAFIGFYNLISNPSGSYFGDGRYTIGSIGPIYCEGSTWSTAVSRVVLEIMQYYMGSNWSFPEGNLPWGGDNSEMVKAAQNCFAYCSKWGFEYCMKGCSASARPMYKGTAIGGEFLMLEPKESRQVCNHERHEGHGAVTYHIDCSDYVTWVLYEYAKANSMDEFASAAAAPGMDFSGNFIDIGDSLKYGNQLSEPAKSLAKFMQLVWHKADGGQPTDLLEAGDVLVYQPQGGGPGHVEIWVGQENDMPLGVNPNYDGHSNEEGFNVYSCGLLKKHSYGSNIYCVLKPMPSNTSKYDPFASLVTAPGAGDELLTVASACIQWYAQNGYQYAETESEQVRCPVPPYSSIVNGSFGAPIKNSLLKTYCSRYVGWVLNEYGRINDIPELTDSSDTLATRRKIAQSIGVSETKGPHDYIEGYLYLAKRVASKAKPQTIYDQCFDTVYVSDSIGIGNAWSKDRIMSTLLPGDILIFTINGSHHIEFFAGFDESKSTSDDKIAILRYTAGVAPADVPAYKEGEPLKAVWGLHSGADGSHGFGDLNAVIRLKSSGRSSGTPAGFNQGSDEVDYSIQGSDPSKATYFDHLKVQVDSSKEKYECGLYVPEKVSNNMPVIVCLGDSGASIVGKNMAKLKKVGADAIIIDNWTFTTDKTDACEKIMNFLKILSKGDYVLPDGRKIGINSAKMGLIGFSKGAGTIVLDRPQATEPTVSYRGPAGTSYATISVFTPSDLRCFKMITLAGAASAIQSQKRNALKQVQYVDVYSGTKDEWGSYNTYQNVESDLSRRKSKSYFPWI